MVLAALAMVAAALLWAGSAFGVGFLWAGAVGWGVSQLSFGAVSTLAVMTYAARHAVGKATGVVLVGFSVGLMLGPALFGWLIDLTNGYSVGFGAVVLVLGSATLVGSLLRARLLDVLELFVVPIVVGSGQRLYEHEEQIQLRLLESRPFPNGVLLTRYAPEGR